MKRQAMKKSTSRRVFTQTASKKHKKNGQNGARVMRGGFRL